MRWRQWLLWSLLTSVLIGAGPAWAEPRLVRACDNDQDYPPFRWRETGPDGQQQIKGLGHAVLRHILAKHGWRLEIDLLPIRRCLQEVATGKRYQLLVSSSPNPERERTYLLTEAFDHVHFHSFYLQRRFPQGSPVQSKQDLQQLKVCGLAGHNFSMFGLKPEQIDTEADNFSAVFQQLRSERCDVLPYNLEAIEGLRLIGQDVLNTGEFAHALIPDVPPTPVLMLITRHYRYSKTLQIVINAELLAMRANGELERLQKMYKPAAMPAEANDVSLLAHP